MTLGVTQPFAKVIKRDVHSDIIRLLGGSQGSGYARHNTPLYQKARNVYTPLRAKH